MVPPGIRALANWSEKGSQAPTVKSDPRITEQLTADVLSAIVSSAECSEQEKMERIEDAQLNHEVEQTILLAQGGGLFPEEGLQLKQHLLDIERNLIRHALSSAEGNVSKTARLLNLQRTTLIEKINKHGLADSA
jgi:sigma-54 specific flagellar transcriptional regulator A